MCVYVCVSSHITRSKILSTLSIVMAKITRKNVRIMAIVVPSKLSNLQSNAISPCYSALPLSTCPLQPSRAGICSAYAFQPPPFSSHAADDFGVFCGFDGFSLSVLTWCVPVVEIFLWCFLFIWLVLSPGGFVPTSLNGVFFATVVLTSVGAYCSSNTALTACLG